MKSYLSLCLVFCASVILLRSSSGAEVQHGNDGTFCTSTGYLAYEDLELTNGRVSSHSIKVVRFGPERIQFAETVMLPEKFSVHWMICGPQQIEMGGPVIRSSPIKCVATLGDTTQAAQCVDDSRADMTSFVLSPSLSVFGPNESPFPLDSADADHSYQLLRHLSHRSVPGGTEYRSECEVVQIDEKGTISKHLVIYDSRRLDPDD